MRNWELKKVGEVCSFEGGSQPPKSQFSYEKKEGYVRLIQIRDYKSDKNIVYIPENKAKRFCDEDDIMIGRYGPPVFQILKGLKGAYNVALMKAIPNEEILSKDYAFMFLKYSKIQDYIVHLSQRAAGQTGVNKEAIQDYPILVPPLSEQQRIVAILNEAFAAIAKAKANAEQNLKNAKELFLSIFDTLTSNEISDWTSATLEKVVKPEKGAMRTGPFGSQLLHSEFVEEGIAVLGIDNAVANEFQWREKRYITPEKFQVLKRYQVKPQDILITIMGTCGRCAIVPDDIPVAINTKHLCCITLDQKKCMPEYLHAFFLYHPIAQSYLQKKAKGAIMAGLNMGIIKEMPLLLPPLKTQKALVEKVKFFRSQSQQLEVLYQKKIDDLEELKKSILQKAFSGELKTLEAVTL